MKYNGIEFVEEEVVEIKKVATFNFQFTEEECAVLFAILGRIGGEPDESPRGVLTPTFKVLEQLSEKGEFEPLATSHEQIIGILFQAGKNQLWFADNWEVEARRAKNA